MRHQTLPRGFFFLKTFELATSLLKVFTNEVCFPKTGDHLFPLIIQELTNQWRPSSCAQ